MNKQTSLLILFLVFTSSCVLYYFTQRQLLINKATVEEHNNFFDSSNVLMIVDIPEEKNIPVVMQENVFNKQKKQIKIKNNITEKMLTYAHWSGNYKPTTFIVTINDELFLPNEFFEIALNEYKTIKIRYDYSFLNGYKQGSQEIEFFLGDNKQEYELHFSWHIPTHLLIEGAEIKNVTIQNFNERYNNNEPT